MSYVTDEARGKSWTMKLGDSCERLREIDSDSVGLSIYSPPFSSLYTYSPSDRDLGNSRSHEEFHEHYRFIVDELLRVMMPGRLVAVHCAQVPTQKWRDGAIGLVDFRGELIRAHTEAGFIFHGEICIWKNPQAQATRTKATSLMFVSLERDGVAVRPALADYLLIFRKPGDNPEPVNAECTRNEWIEWASPIWIGEEHPDRCEGPFSSCWFDIRETKTLNAAAAREERDERHICPLQLDLIERAIRLWTNPGDLVLSPFAGIGSELYEAIRLGRRGIGIELKPSYWQTACRNLEIAESEANRPTLFDEVA